MEKDNKDNMVVSVVGLQTREEHNNLPGLFDGIGKYLLSIEPEPIQLYSNSEGLAALKEAQEAFMTAETSQPAIPTWPNVETIYKD